jgi:short-subunit dehydrogenase
MIDSAKNVLITGGAKGLGAHLARHLSAQGHRILVLDRTASEDLAADYRETLTEYMTVDLADWSAVHDGIERLLAKHEGRIDVLINNAAAGSFDDFSAFNRAEIDRCIQVNFKTPVLLTHELLPVMKQNGYGRIINMGSRSGFRAYPSGSLYCSTKSALVVFTESVGAELEGAQHAFDVFCSPRTSHMLVAVLKFLDSVHASPASSVTPPDLVALPSLAAARGRP